MKEENLQPRPKPEDKLYPPLISIDLQKLEDESLDSNLHLAEIKLISLIRSIEFGEIESLKIQNGLPITYKMAWKTGKFI